jgi:hypothetical protein
MSPMLFRRKSAVGTPPHVSGAQVCVIAFLLYAMSLNAQNGLQDPRASALRLIVADRNNPTLAIVLPAHPQSDRSIEVVFPEHVTAKRHGSSEPEHLYLSTGGQQVQKPVWRQTGNSLEYERDLSGGIHFLATATLVSSPTSLRIGLSDFPDFLRQLPNEPGFG